MLKNQCLTRISPKTKLLRVKDFSESSNQEAMQAEFRSLGIHYTILSSEFILIQRDLTVAEKRRIYDVFGRGWVFISGQIIEGGVSALKSEGPPIEIPSQESFSAYLPAFSVVEWLVEPGLVKIEMLTSTKKLDMKLPPYPVVYPQKRPGTIFDHYQDFVENGPPESIKNISRPCSSCSLSERVYAHIRAHYREPLSIGDLSKKLKTSPSVLSRYFKRCFGATPIALLNQMRVMNSLGDLLWDDKKVLDIAMDSGYSNVRVYNEQFSKIVGNPPSELQKKRPVEL